MHRQSGRLLHVLREVYDFGQGNPNSSAKDVMVSPLTHDMYRNRGDQLECKWYLGCLPNSS